MILTSFDLFPLWNSLRIALIASLIVFFLGILLAYYISKLPRIVKGILDVFLTLPLVLPPTVVGYFLVLILGNNSPIGQFLTNIGLPFFMTWRGAIIASVVVSFPLMYRTVRGAFETFDEDLAFAGRTLGLSNTYIFWRIRIPYCKSGLIAGSVLAFARALGEYGATSMFVGYIKGKTATIATAVYNYWTIGNDTQALIWVLINITISTIVLLTINLFENRKGGRKHVY